MERPRFLRPDIPFVYSNTGFRSECFRSEEKAIKVLKKPLSREKAWQTCYEFQKQYQLLSTHLNPYVPKTQFVIGSEEKGAKITMVQPFLEGITIQEAINTYDKDKLIHIKTFLEKSLDFYEKIGMMPDILGPAGSLEWYSPRKSANVIVTERENVPFPQLVDCVFSRVTTNKYIGPMNNYLLAQNTQRVLDAIS